MILALQIYLIIGLVFSYVTTFIHNEVFEDVESKSVIILAYVLVTLFWPVHLFLAMKKVLTEK